MVNRLVLLLYVSRKNLSMASGKRKDTTCVRYASKENTSKERKKHETYILYAVRSDDEFSEEKSSNVFSPRASRSRSVIRHNTPHIFGFFCACHLLDLYWLLVLISRI